MVRGVRKVKQEVKMRDEKGRRGANGGRLNKEYERREVTEVEGNGRRVGRSKECEKKESE